MSSVLRTALLALLALSSCGCSSQSRPPKPPSLTVSWTQIPLLPDSLVLELRNSSESAACVPDIEAKESVSFTQFGKEVERFSYTNRAILEWRGADLIGGMIVVPPGKHVEIYFNLNEWIFRQAKASASAHIPVYDCLEFFRNTSPQSVHLNSQFSFSAPLSSPPND